MGKSLTLSRPPRVVGMDREEPSSLFGMEVVFYESVGLAPARLASSDKNSNQPKRGRGKTNGR